MPELLKFLIFIGTYRFTDCKELELKRKEYLQEFQQVQKNSRKKRLPATFLMLSSLEVYRPQKNRKTE